MVERVFEDTDLDVVKAQAKSYIEQKMQEGFHYTKAKMLREGEKRVCIVYMEPVR